MSMFNDGWMDVLGITIKLVNQSLEYFNKNNDKKDLNDTHNPGVDISQDINEVIIFPDEGLWASVASTREGELTLPLAAYEDHGFIIKNSTALRKLLQRLNEAEHTIRVCVMGLTSKHLAEALVYAKVRDCLTLLHLTYT